MGYRSKVIIGVTYGELSDKFDEVLIKHDFHPIKSTDYLKIHIENDGMKFYTFDYTKWYSSDEWCKDIMDFLEHTFNTTTTSTDLSKVFCVGLGEEGELHSEVGDYWEFVDVIRNINLID
jgi:hypothetical protein